MDRESIINEYVLKALGKIDNRLDTLSENFNSLERRFNTMEVNINFIKGIFTKRWVWLLLISFLVFIAFLDHHQIISFFKSITGIFH